MRTPLTVLALALTAVMLGPAVAAAVYDGSAPLVCAVNTIMECDASGQCQRHTAHGASQFPSLLRVNVPQKLISAGGPDGRKTQIQSVTRLDGRLILHGGENGRGWAATIGEQTGRLSASVVADEFTFALFGACTTP
jgi:hypothetical protein